MFASWEPPSAIPIQIMTTFTPVCTCTSAQPPIWPLYYLNTTDIGAVWKLKWSRSRHQSVERPERGERLSSGGQNRVGCRLSVVSLYTRGYHPDRDWPDTKPHRLATLPTVPSTIAQYLPVPCKSQPPQGEKLATQYATDLRDLLVVGDNFSLAGKKSIEVRREWVIPRGCPAIFSCPAWYVYYRTGRVGEEQAQGLYQSVLTQISPTHTSV